MKTPFLQTLFLATALLFGAGAIAGDEVMSVSTNWNALTPNDKIVVEVFDDEKVKGAACFVSYAKTGGAASLVGMAEDPSRFSIACRAIGKIDEKALVDLKDEETIFNERRSAIFKSLYVKRHYDRARGVLVYLAYSKRVISGSPYNSVSAISLRAAP